MNGGNKIVRIGGGSGFWGDTSLGPAQLFATEGIQYVVLDYLAEVTMSVLAKAKAKDPDAGYAIDFITQVMRPFLATIVSKKVRVVTNAGGLNLFACRRALEKSRHRSQRPVAGRRRAGGRYRELFRLVSKQHPRNG